MSPSRRTSRSVRKSFSFSCVITDQGLGYCYGGWCLFRFRPVICMFTWFGNWQLLLLMLLCTDEAEAEYGEDVLHNASVGE